MKSENFIETAPDIQEIEGPTLTTEQRICQLIRARIKEKKLKIKSIAEQIQPAISESQLRHLLNGGSPLSMDRFMQIARIVDLDPITIIQRATPEPKFSLAFSQEQESYLVADPWRYKIMKAFSNPRSIEDIRELFPECSKVEKIVKDLIDLQIITKHGEGFFRINTRIPQFTPLRFSEDYTRLIQSLLRDMHETTVAVQTERPDLVKYVRNMLVVDYFTPEQMMSIREKSLELYSEIRRFIAKNRADRKYDEMAKRNLVAIMTISSPINMKSFIKAADKN